MDQFDKRLDKLEDKVDAIREDVTELKTDFKIHTALIQEHVTGDAKIISELKPILHKLPDIIQIVEDHQLKLCCMHFYLLNTLIMCMLMQFVH